PQTSVPAPPTGKQAPVRGPFAGRSKVQSSPADLPAQGCVRSTGSGGGTGAQARLAPLTVARQVPAMEKSASAFPLVSRRVRVQDAPGARPAHAPVCWGDGAHSSGLAAPAPPSVALVVVGPPSLAVVTSPAPIAAALAGGLVPPSHPSRSPAAQRPARAVMEVESSRARIVPLRASAG